MEKIKVLYVVSDLNKSIAFEWIAAHLDHQKFELQFVFIHAEEPLLLREISSKGIPCFFIKSSGKKSFPGLWLKLIRHMRAFKPQVVHSHLFNATLLGLSAARLLGVEKRIYTRHHSSFHHDFMPKAVKWDKLCNFLATDIVAISKNVEVILREKEQVEPAKITLIHHGFDLNAFRQVEASRVEALREKYGIHENAFPVVGLIARQIKWKGIQYVIPAFKRFLEKNPRAVLILANAGGPDRDFISRILEEQLSPENYLEIPFEADLFALYHLFDFFVHVPINSSIEAYGQVYVEALAAGIPSIFTLSGVACEFIEHEKNALVVDYQSAASIYTAMCRLMEEQGLKQQLVEEGLVSVKDFNLATFIHELNALYEGK